MYEVHTIEKPHAHAASRLVEIHRADEPQRGRELNAGILPENGILADGLGRETRQNPFTLPLLKPSLAAVGFMMATAYWNDWQNAQLYIVSNNKKPLQLLLINIQKSIEFLLNNNNVPASVRAAMGGTIPQYSSTMATVVIVIAPIMVVYPFFQKYFVKGLTVGSVKG